MSVLSNRHPLATAYFAGWTLVLVPVACLAVVGLMVYGVAKCLWLVLTEEL